MDMRIALAVAAGSAVGGVRRYGISETLVHDVVPVGTLAVNVVGSFALGVLLFHPGIGRGLDPAAQGFLAAGVLGGFTTMSTFSFEAVTLSETGLGSGGAYVVATLVGCIGGAAGGRWLALWWGG